MWFWLILYFPLFINHHLGMIWLLSWKFLWSSVRSAWRAPLQMGPSRDSLKVRARFTWINFLGFRTSGFVSVYMLIYLKKILSSKKTWKKTNLRRKRRYIYIYMIIYIYIVPSQSHGLDERCIEKIEVTHQTAHLTNVRLPAFWCVL